MLNASVRERKLELQTVREKKTEFIHPTTHDCTEINLIVDYIQFGVEVVNVGFNRNFSIFTYRLSINLHIFSALIFNNDIDSFCVLSSDE
jgi:hypothetical protein